MQTYLFYDIESTGLNKCFDQVLQFAAIRTDLQLNELERHNFLVKLNPDVIPNPYASITHHISIQQTIENGISELEAMEKIHALLNKPGTISLGYNTLRFDDEFLRFSFYRNLLTPYTHQYANNCSRMDLYPMTIMFNLFKNDVLKWPKKNGQPSLKLDAINALNNLAEGQAHDALVDVEATIALAKIFIKERSMWDYLCGYFNKNEDKARIAKLANAENLSHKIGLMIHGPIGSKHLYQAPVLHLGTHYHYKNQEIWLRLDKKELINSKIDGDLTKTAWTINKKIAEIGLMLPLNSKYSKHLTDKVITRVNNNLTWLQENPQILTAICDHFLNYTYPEVQGVDVDAALYGSKFWSAQETSQCKRFHSAKTEQKFMLAEGFNNNLKNLAMRCLGRFNSSLLPQAQNIDFQNYINKTMSLDIQDLAIDFRGDKKYGMAQAKQDIEKARKEVQLSARQQDLLIELEQYLKKD